MVWKEIITAMCSGNLIFAFNPLCHDVSTSVRYREQFLLGTYYKSCYKRFTPKNVTSDYAELMS